MPTLTSTQQIFEISKSLLTQFGLPGAYLERPQSGGKWSIIKIHASNDQAIGEIVFDHIALLQMDADQAMAVIEAEVKQACKACSTEPGSLLLKKEEPKP